MSLCQHVATELDVVLDHALHPIHRRHDRLETVLDDHDDTLASLIDRMAAVELDIQRNTDVLRRLVADATPQA